MTRVLILNSLSKKVRLLKHMRQERAPPQGQQIVNVDSFVAWELQQFVQSHINITMLQNWNDKIHICTFVNLVIVRYIKQTYLFHRRRPPCLRTSLPPSQTNGRCCIAVSCKQRMALHLQVRPAASCCCLWCHLERLCDEQIHKIPVNKKTNVLF